MTSPTDWGSGERVFGPPGGTLDVDWLVPALLERVGTATPETARRALAAAWSAYRTGRPAAPPAAVAAGALPVGTPEPAEAALAATARQLVREAAREYGVPPGSGSPTAW